MRNNMYLSSTVVQQWVWFSRFYNPWALLAGVETRGGRQGPMAPYECEIFLKFE
jgi:hypothetical protein